MKSGGEVGLLDFSDCRLKVMEDDNGEEWGR